MDLETYLKVFESVLDALTTAEIDRLVDAIVAAYETGRCVFIIGNGGSAANASHLCEDLGKGTLKDFEHQKRLKVISLTDNVPYLLAWGNDTGFERVFVEQLRNLAAPGDLLIAISGSGSSPNVLRAVEHANGAGLLTFGVAGYDGGKLRQIAQDCLWVRCDNMGMVEAAHDVVFHYLTEVLKGRFAQTGGYR
jgi:D-sedoheptulose 7-phosphate isomerase